jgi:ribonuclease BN (tRNA processing enzyme)
MTRHVLKAYREDMHIRINGLEMGNPEGYKVNVQEIKEGLIHQDELIKVYAFRVEHGSWKHAYGFRFETPDKVIVVSGDATYSESLIKNARDCDILVHEVFSQIGLDRREDRWKKYHSTFHTSPEQLGRIAQKVKPKLLVLNHQLTFGETLDGLMAEVRKYYNGSIVQGKDLDVYE